MAAFLVSIRCPASITASPPQWLIGTDGSARSCLSRCNLPCSPRLIRRLAASTLAEWPSQRRPSFQSHRIASARVITAMQRVDESQYLHQGNSAISLATLCIPPYMRITAVALAAASCSLLLALSPAMAAAENDALLDIQTLRPRVQEQINESYVKRDGQDLSVSDLQGATFMEASLRGTDLHGSDLRGAMFTKAVLYKANLSGADLSDALIDRAVLNDADLRNAVLRGAWLALTDLGGADITGADFTDAIIDKYQLKQLCLRASGVNTLTGADTAESLRCASTRFYSGSGSSR